MPGRLELAWLTWLMCRASAHTGAAISGNQFVFPPPSNGSAHQRNILILVWFCGGHAPSLPPPPPHTTNNVLPINRFLTAG